MKQKKPTATNSGKKYCTVGPIPK